MLAGFRKVIVVIDREQRPDCPGEFARAVREELGRQLNARFGYEDDPPLSVVCADRTLENWLVADPTGISQHAYIGRDIRRRVGTNADGLDALSIIRDAYRSGRHYHKARDAPALAAKVRVDRSDVRARSKSLNKLLREAGG